MKAKFVGKTPSCDPSFAIFIPGNIYDLCSSIELVAESFTPFTISKVYYAICLRDKNDESRWYSYKKLEDLLRDWELLKEEVNL